MTSHIEKLQNDLAFYQSITPIVVELEEARETRHTDGDRWLAASQEWGALSLYWGGIRDYIAAVDAPPPTEGLTSINVDTLASSSEAVSLLKGN